MLMHRNVRLDELDAFCSIADPDTNSTYRHYLASSMEAGETSPDRWFAALDGDHIVGRIVFWSLPGSPHVSLDVFALPWIEPEHAARAPAFLAHALAAIARQGVCSVTYERHEPDPEAHTPAALIDTLLASGFREGRRTIRFELTPVRPTPALSRVAFEGLADGVTIDDVVAVVHRCAFAGKDTAVAARAADLGDAARSFVDATASMRGGTSLWRIALIDGEVVGAILPTANDGGPVLNYIGVVPDRRGERLVDEFLAETARLQQVAGAERVRADSDAENTAMHAAFARAGWAEFGRRTSYELRLGTE